MNRFIYLKYGIFFSMAFSIFSASCQDNSETRIKGWQADIDTLISAIQARHYIYKTKALPEALTTNAKKLKQQVKNFSDERMLIELERLMYFLGDGHSYILPAGAEIVHAHYLPLHFYQFSDGLFIIDADKPYQHLIGNKVLKIGDVSVQQFMKDMVSFVSQDNIMGAVWIGPFFLRFRGMLESYGLSKNADSAVLQMQNSSGDIFEKKVLFIPVPRLSGIPKLIPSQLQAAPQPPLYLSNVQSSYWLKEMPEKKALYVQFNQVTDDPGETLKDFCMRLDSVIRKSVPLLLLIDVRHNNGGHGELITPFIQTLKDFERTIPGGKIIIITGRNTFSAAQIFISKVDKETKAVFAGEPGSSKPNIVGEENVIVLPFSGAICSISNRYHESIPGDTRNWIEPDIKIELSSSDYFANRDPVLEAILQ